MRGARRRGGRDRGKSGDSWRGEGSFTQVGGWLTTSAKGCLTAERHDGYQPVSGRAGAYVASNLPTHRWLLHVQYRVLFAGSRKQPATDGEEGAAGTPRPVLAPPRRPRRGHSLASCGAWREAVAQFAVPPRRARQGRAPRRPREAAAARARPPLDGWASADSRGSGAVGRGGGAGGMGGALA